jgi:tetratricopeptide (TPR) repeat protein
MEIAGRLYARQGRYARAQHCLQQALAIDPQRRSAALVLAQIFAAREDWDAATRTAAQTGGEAAALFSAQKAQQKNDVAEAIAQYETALRRGDPDGVAANNLAWLYAQQGARLNRALALAEKARTLTPADPAVLDTVGVVHLRRREYTDAITVLQTAAALAGQASPNQPKLTTEIRKHLAEACLRAGVAVQ